MCTNQRRNSPDNLAWAAGLAMVLLAACSAQADDAAAVKKELFRGKVVRTVDALKAAGVKAYPEELQGQVALVTPAGEIIPIVPDWRGRAFYQDRQLRDRDVELIGSRKPGVTFLQVIAVYTFDKQGVRQFTDYWCDVCAIPMYEIKLCDCCQQEIRLRFQPQELPAEFLSGKGQTSKSETANSQESPSSNSQIERERSHQP